MGGVGGHTGLGGSAASTTAGEGGVSVGSVGGNAMGGGADGGSGGAAASGTELGTLSGECGQLDLAVLQAPSPTTLQNSIDLGAAGFTLGALSIGGESVYDATGPGASSAASEALSFDVLSSCETGVLLKTSDQIAYDTASKEIDYIMEIAGKVVGVSVVRAFGFPDDSSYTQAAAEGTISKKLSDLQLSAGSVSADDKWQKGVVHVIARSIATASLVLAAYATLQPEVKGDAVLLVTVTEGSDEAIYSDQ
jgi:hypothetical protein